MEEDKILPDLRNNLGIFKDDSEFDTEIILHTNSAFSTLYQIGVGKDFPIRIASSDDTWASLFEGYEKVLPFIKEYTYLKVRMLFDPPSNSSVMESLKQTMKEVEYRIMMEIDGVFNDGK